MKLTYELLWLSIVPLNGSHLCLYFYRHLLILTTLRPCHAFSFFFPHAFFSVCTCSVTYNGSMESPVPLYPTDCPPPYEAVMGQRASSQVKNINNI